MLEIKSVERLVPLHVSQLLTYLRVSGCWVGLLMNFNCVRLKDGLRKGRRLAARLLVLPCLYFNTKKQEGFTKKQEERNYWRFARTCDLERRETQEEIFFLLLRENLPASSC